MSGEILVKINRPQGNLSMNFQNMKAGSLQIVAYNFSGLVSTSPLFISFGNIPFSTLITGTTDPVNFPVDGGAFPLFVDAVPNSTVNLNVPVTVMNGDNQMPDTRDLLYKVTDVSNNPAVFTLLVLRMVYIPVAPRFPVLDGNEIKMKETRRVVERNQKLNNKNRGIGFPNESFPVDY